jgi:uncharacterized membrane protein
MNSGRRLFDEKTLRVVFFASLWIKAAFALIEILGGIAAWFLTRQTLVEWAGAITQGELAEDSHDLLANYLLHSAQNLSVGAQHFAAVYLLGHGVVKLWLVAVAVAGASVVLPGRDDRVRAVHRLSGLSVPFDVFAVAGGGDGRRCDRHRADVA